MSMKTYLEALEFVLDSEREAQHDLIVFRPGARRALEEAERDVPLPRMGSAAFSVALGASMTGMHPVLDLRQESDAAALLKEAVCALPPGVSPAMTVIVCAGDPEAYMDLPGVQSLAPKTPRQAAGFARAALRGDRLNLLIVDQTLFAEEDDVPEDSDFILLPLDGDVEPEAKEDGEAGCGECLADELAEAAEAMDAANADQDSDEEENFEETAYEATAEEDVLTAVPEEAEADVPAAEDECCAPAEGDSETVCADDSESEAEGEEAESAPPAGQMCFCATRMTPCDLKNLLSLCDMLEAPAEKMIGRCMAHAAAGRIPFEWQYESEAVEGECAFLPPVEEVVSLWLGSDMLTVSYDAACLSHGEAAAILRAAKRVLEKPALLIYDKEREGE